MSVETWRDIAGFSGKYQVSNEGRVRNSDRHILRPFKNRNCKYYRVCLSRPVTHVSEKWLVHRLVAESFIDCPGSGYVVNHKDGNKLNNNVSNLEWVTPSENSRHAYAHGLMHNIEPTRLAHFKKVKCSNGKTYRSATDAARELGLKVGTVTNAARKGHTLRAGYAFEYC